MKRNSIWFVPMVEPFQLKTDDFAWMNLLKHTQEQSPSCHSISPRQTLIFGTKRMKKHSVTLCKLSFLSFS